MIIPILHLSDLHLSTKNDLQLDRFKKITETVQNAPTESDALLLITGDFANTGDAKEFDIASLAINEIITNLNQKGYKVHLFLVPGNHDIEIEEGYDARTIREKLKTSTKHSLYLDALANMDTFFIFAEEYGLSFEQPTLKTIIDISGKRSLEVVLLNSAPFSTREPDDKELHFIPADNLNPIKKVSDTNLSIVLSHHGTEWFTSETKDYLEDLLLENCDLFFIGHEHECHIERISREGNRSILLSRSGMINTNNYEISSFALHYLDIESLNIESAIYKWDPQASMYARSEKRSEQIKLKQPHRIAPEKGFVKEILSEEPIHGMSINDIFVFPDLSIEGFEENSLDAFIDTEEKLFEFIRDNRIICINGRAGSGKTTLLKQMYKWSIEEGYSPLYLSRDNNMKSHNRLFDAMIGDQYGTSDIAREKFNQVSKNKKVLFIDDFDKLKDSKGSRSGFFEKAFGVVERIIFVSDMSQSADIGELIKERFDHKYSVKSLRLKELYKEKRDQLVKKVCHIKNCDPETTDTLVLGITKTVHGNRQLCDLNPDFIIQNVVYRLNNLDFMLDDDIPFGIIYDYNLRSELKNSCHGSRASEKKTLIDATMRVLQAFAYEMHRLKQEQLSINDFVNVAQNYIDEKALNEFNPKDILELAENSVILQKAKDPRFIEFKSMNYLAFFVAKELDTRIKHAVNVQADLDYLLKYSCFNINKSILLFLSILREDVNFPISLCEEIEKQLKDIKTFSFDEKNIGFMCAKPLSNLGMMEYSDKEEAAKAISTAEEEHDKNLNLYEGVYEYDESIVESLPFKLLRALIYVDMVGRSYRAQYVDLPKESKSKMQEVLFSAPDQILYGFLSFLDNDQVVDGLYIGLKDELGLNDRKQIIAFIREFGFIICLTIYEQVAFSSSQRSTWKSLTDAAPNTTNGRILKLFMHAHGCTPSEFIKKSAHAFGEAKNHKNLVEMNYIRAIVNWYIANHDLDGRTMREVRNSGIFSNDESKKLMKAEAKKQNRESLE